MHEGELYYSLSQGPVVAYSTTASLTNTRLFNRKNIQVMILSRVAAMALFLSFLAKHFAFDLFVVVKIRKSHFDLSPASIGDRYTFAFILFCTENHAENLTVQEPCTKRRWYV